MKKDTIPSRIQRQLMSHLECLDNLISLIDQQACFRYGFSDFLQKYLEYYFVEYETKNQKNIEDSRIIKFITEFDIDLLFPERIWNFYVTERFLNQILSHNVKCVYLIMKLILQGKFHHLNTIMQVESADQDFKTQNQQFYNLKFPLEIQENWDYFDQALWIRLSPIQGRKYKNSNKITLIDQMTFLEITGRGIDLNPYINFILDNVVLEEKMITIEERNKRNLIKPRRFLDYEQKEYYFDKDYKRWFNRQIEENREKCQAQIDYQKSIRHLITKYLYTPDFNQYQKLLQNVPSLKLKPNKKQYLAIAEQEVAIVIGRSGSGKSTMSLLKLFITDIVFNLRQTAVLKCPKDSEKIQLKTLFLTQSPLLAWQMKQKYSISVKQVEKDLKDNIRNQNNQINEFLEEKEEKEPCKQQNFVEQSESDSWSEGEIINHDDGDEEEIVENQEDIDQYEQEMGYFDKFSDIKTFPVFLTIRKLLFLIDSNLQNSFFKNKPKVDRSAQWHNEQIGTFSLNQPNFQTNNQTSLNKTINELDETDEIIINNQLQEVNLDIFLNLIWPKILQKLSSSNYKQYIFKLNPTMVWFEIINEIKGDLWSYNNCYNYLPYQNYLSSKNYARDDYQSINSAYSIYECFRSYEIIKEQLGYYDLLDLVNHIISELKFNHDSIELVHFIVLDELQDVPIKFLILLSKLAVRGLFLSGDNAQNIFKGARIQFKQIGQILNKINQDHPIKKRKVNLYQLDRNYRSTQQILLVGNSIIRILELLCSKDLDSLPFERSSKQGKRPIIINKTNFNTLLHCLAKYNKSKDQYNLSLSHNSVIIVRDQESKLKIPNQLQNLLILTLYESKGLEFDEVILFNFFTESPCSQNEWEQLEKLEVSGLIQNNLSSENNQKGQKKSNIENILHQINVKNNQNISGQSLGVSFELKLLYVAVTRPRNKLIIFDEIIQKRRPMQKLLIKLNAIQIFDEEGFDDQLTQQRFEFVVDNNNNWKRQGFKMFQRNNYEQAYKCFKFAEDEFMAKKSLAYNKATQAALNNNAKEFLIAGKLFEEINLQKRAAQCYFSGKNYVSAYELYKQINLKKEAAESAYLAGFYDKAGELFQEVSEFHRAIDCFEQCQMWDEIFSMIDTNQSYLTIQEKSFYYKKYLPKLFEQITDSIEKEQNEIQNIPRDNESQSFSVQNSQAQNFKLEHTQSFQIYEERSYDHLSLYDPDDEWLKNDQILNVLDESIPIKKHIQFAQQNLQENQQLFLSNQSIKNLIHRVGWLQSQEKKNQLFQQNSNEVVSEQTVLILLEQLERLNNYKLCIFLSNQFNLVEKLGRYISLLMSKYSPLNNSFSKTSFKNLLKNSNKRRQLREQGVLSKIVLNNILKLIQPSYYAFKYEKELSNESSFELNTLKQLIYLGYWQNVLGFVNFKYALDLCLSFNDYENLIKLFNDQISLGINQTASQNNLLKFKYFLGISKFLLDKQYSFTFSEPFGITNELLSTKEIQQKSFTELIHNFYCFSSDSHSQNFLKQIESTILCFCILNGNLIVQNLSLQNKIELTKIYLKCLNQIKSPSSNPNIIESLQFLYKFSYSQGELMSSYPQYIICSVDSEIFKKNCDKALPIDINFEHFLLPIESLQSLKQINHNFNFTFIEEEQIIDDKYIYSTLAQIQFSYQLQFILQNLFNKKVSNYYYKINYHQSAVHNFENENEIQSLLKNQNIKNLHNFLLQSNSFCKNDNFKRMEQYTIREGLELFNEALKSEERQQHGFIIFAINLLNFSQCLPLALFTINQHPEKIKRSTYTKYIEFLECQNQMVIEDMFDCYFEYFDQVQNIIFNDEWLHHLIRLGIFIVICYHPSDTLIFPENYLNYVSKDQILELVRHPFKIEHDEFITKYLENLYNFLLYSEKYYAKQAYLIIIIILINTKSIKSQIVNQILFICNQENEIAQAIKENLFRDHQGRLRYFVQEQNQSIKHYGDKKVIELQIKIQQGIIEQKDKYYQTCLEHWDNLIKRAELLEVSGKKLLKFWGRKKKNNIYDPITQAIVIRLLKTEQIPKQELLKIQCHAEASGIFDIQKELIQKIYLSRGNQFLEIHQQLQKTEILIFKLTKNYQILEETKEVKKWLKDHEELIFKQNKQNEEEQKYQKEILRKKWQNLKAGVKVQNSQNLNGVQQVEEQSLSQI